MVKHPLIGRRWRTTPSSAPALRSLAQLQDWRARGFWVNTGPAQSGRLTRPPAKVLAQMLALSFGALALASCGGGGDSKKGETPAVTKPTVSVQVAGGGAGADGLRAAGVVAYQQETALSFRTPGLVRQILVDEGDSVRAGQVLARLDLNDLNASVAEAQTGVRNAENQLARDTSLFQRGFIAQARLDASELALARAKSALTSVQFNRDQGVITAPTAGVVLRRLAEPNQNAGAGSPILVLGSKTAGVIVRAGVSADAVRRVKVGDRADVRMVDGKFRQGRVSQVSAQSNAATNAFDVEVSLGDAADLRSGQVAEVLITTKTVQTARLRIPITALLDARADQGFIYVVGDGDVAQRRAVRTAGVEGEDVVIAEGLNAGERIIIAGSAFIRDGQAVTVVNAPSVP